MRRCVSVDDYGEAKKWADMAGKILVAEDDPEARELLILLLGAADYSVLEAADGHEALQLVRSERPDLLITDIVMPRMDGYELVRRVREDRSIASTPVVFCSASYHERDVRAMARSLGVLQTLAKPYDVAAVQSVIAQVLSKATQSPIALRVEEAAAFEMHATQDRLSALVAFSRQLFTNAGVQLIPGSACRGAREILMAQCAELVLRDAAGLMHRCREGGMADERLQQLMSARMFLDLAATVAAGGTAIYPMVPPAPTVQTGAAPAGEFTSMLGVPVATGSQVYGYLCFVNRIGLSGFTEEDVSIARAIAAQVAVAQENSLRRQALEDQIVQRTAAEAEVRRLNLDLEQRVAERTAELQIANRELEAFSYSVAHDLRAPLRLIDARVQMLSDELQMPASRSDATVLLHHVDHIRRGGNRMSALIDGLLALSRVSHVEMRKEQVALGELVEEVRERIAAQNPQRNIEWRIAPLPRLYCDAELMRVVFTNLLDNAVKYSSPRARAIIGVGLGLDDDQQLHIYVSDNGVGFDTRYANKLFGVFQRLHHANEFEGTGIGLATVSRIIERHGGRIWAEAALGAGAIFRVTIAGLTPA